MQEKAKIYELLMNELKTYPTCQITPEGLAKIAERLDSRYTYEQIEEAMNRLAFKAKFFPSLAEIVDNIQAHRPSKLGVTWVEPFEP